MRSIRIALADDTIVPLCPTHHRGRFSPHGPDAKEFHETYTKEMMLNIASKLHKVFQDGKWNFRL